LQSADTDPESRSELALRHARTLADSSDIGGAHFARPPAGAEMGCMGMT
jgi:hypothetical protein